MHSPSAHRALRPCLLYTSYLGGPLTFSTVLRKSFDEALGVTGTCPENSLLYGVEGSAQRDVEQAVLGAGAGDAQCLVEALAQHGAEGQRTAQIEDIALDGASLCQTGEDVYKRQW